MTEMLTRPDLAGKVAVFTEMRDTVGLIMLDQGADPSDFTDEQFDAAIALLQESVDSGHIRQFADANYGQSLSKGNFAASMTYSGDINQLQIDNPELELVIPEAGFILWSDNLLVPVGALHQANAEKWIDFYYRPEVAAQVAAWVNFITPVVGAKEVLAKIDPELADNELIFPSEEFLAQGHIFKALDDEEETRYQDAFNARARPVGHSRMGCQGGRQVGVDPGRTQGAVLAVLLAQHLALGVQARHQVAAVVGHDDLDVDRAGAAARPRCARAARRCPGRCAPRRRRRPARGRRSRAIVIGSARSALLMTTISGRFCRADLVEHLAHRRQLALGVGVGGVDDVQHEVGVGDLLQRRAERLDQLVRQVADEADGVGEGVQPAVGGVRLAHGRVEGGEQRVVDEHAGAGEPVHQARLAGVGVAGDRHGRDAVGACGVHAWWRATSPWPAARGAAWPPCRGCDVGRSRSWSHRDHAYRRHRSHHRRGHRPVGTATHPSRAGVAAGTASAPATPAPCPHGSWRAGRRCRGSARCGRRP